MKTLVILLNWNGTTDTLECLESLRQCAGRRFDVAVVENGSRFSPNLCHSVRHFY